MISVARRWFVIRLMKWAAGLGDEAVVRVAIPVL